MDVVFRMASLEVGGERERAGMMNGARVKTYKLEE